jgi:hypothetical protein
MTNSDRNLSSGAQSKDLGSAPETRLPNAGWQNLNSEPLRQWAVTIKDESLFTYH